MATIRLTDGGKEFPFQYGLLLTLASHYPDEPQYAGLAHALIGLGIPSITERLLDKEYLTVEQRDAIWDNGDIGVRRRLLHEQSFLSWLTDAQAKELVEMDDVNMLATVAGWAELLYPGRHGEGGAMRLSGAAADMLINHIRSHENARVRAALAENNCTPAKFYPPLSEYLKEDFSIKASRLDSVTVDDIQALNGQSRELLVIVAGNVECITNSEARRAAVAMLAAHPDPEVRLALVENQDAPRFAYELLSQDAEQEIASAAQRRLRNGE